MARFTRRSFFTAMSLGAGAIPLVGASTPATAGSASIPNAFASDVQLQPLLGVRHQCGEEGTDTADCANQRQQSEVE